MLRLDFKIPKPEIAAVASSFCVVFVEILGAVSAFANASANSLMSTPEPTFIDFMSELPILSVAPTSAMKYYSFTFKCF
jgi:hypothetical protein